MRKIKLDIEAKEIKPKIKLCMYKSYLVKRKSNDEIEILIRGNKEDHFLDSKESILFCESKTHAEDDFEILEEIKLVW